MAYSVLPLTSTDPITSALYVSTVSKMSVFLQRPDTLLIYTAIFNLWSDCRALWCVGCKRDCAHSYVYVVKSICILLAQCISYTQCGCNERNWQLTLTRCESVMRSVRKRLCVIACAHVMHYMFDLRLLMHLQCLGLRLFRSKSVHYK